MMRRMWAAVAGICLIGVAFGSSHANTRRVVVPREVVIASYRCEQASSGVSQRIEFQATFLDHATPLSVESSTDPINGLVRGLCQAATIDVRSALERLGCTAGPIQADDTTTAAERTLQAVCSGMREEMVSVIARLSELVITVP